MSLEYLKANHKRDLIDGIRLENFNSSTPKSIDPIQLNALDLKYLGTKVPMHKVVPDVCSRLLGRREFSSHFRTKHELRKVADYEMNETLYYDDVKQMIHDIEGLIKQLKQKRS